MKKNKHKNHNYMDGFQDRRKANTDPELKPKNLKAVFIKRGPDYERGWMDAAKRRFPK